MENGNYTFHVTLKYRPYNNNIVDIFTGNSEIEAVANLNKYLDMCKEKHGHYVSPFTYKKDKLVEKNENGDEIIIPTDDKPLKVDGLGRGHHFKGKIWVINRQTKEKLRVPAEEIGIYIAKGFIKGGPRTQM